MSEHLYKEAISYWERDSQIAMAIEEMSELTNALMKHRRGLNSSFDVAEEIADVMIMCEHLCLIFSPEIEVIKENKLE